MQTKLHALKAHQVAAFISRGYALQIRTGGTQFLLPHPRLQPGDAAQIQVSPSVEIDHAATDPGNPLLIERTYTPNSYDHNGEPVRPRYKLRMLPPDSTAHRRGFLERGYPNDGSRYFDLAQ